MTKNFKKKVTLKTTKLYLNSVNGWLVQQVNIRADRWGVIPELVHFRKHDTRFRHGGFSDSSVRCSAGFQLKITVGRRLSFFPALCLRFAY